MKAPEQHKIIALLKAFASSLVWGLGQLFNRQWLKALFFFVFFALLIIVETVEIDVVRDNEDDSFERLEFENVYRRDFDIYDMISGESMTNVTSKGHLNEYYYRAQDGEFESTQILEYAAEINDLTFDEDDFVFLDENGQIIEPGNMDFTPDDLFTYLGEHLRTLDEELDLEIYAERAEEDALESIANLADRSYTNFVRDTFNSSQDAANRMDNQVEDLATQALIDDGHDPDDPNFTATLEDYIADNTFALRNEAEEIVLEDLREELYDEHYERIFETQKRLYFTTYYARALNEYYADLLLDDDDIRAFALNLQGGHDSGRDSYGQNSYNKILTTLYFHYNPERFEFLVEQYDNDYYNSRGFFVRGLWGVVTLGESPQRSFSEHNTFEFLLPTSPTQDYVARTLEFSGHHSTQLLLRGIISTLMLLYFVIFWVWGIKDAYKTSLEIHETKKVPSEKKYFANVYEHSFEYIVLMPALFLITFVGLMPILFGMFVAFTNYNAENLPPGQLVNWVGLENFRAIFTLSRDGGMPFGQMFFRVFGWTIVWAVGSTVTVFFGGLFQAVILNNKRVVFRKAWRGLLILPWAVPALISQMIFRVMFTERGYINSVLRDTWVYDFLLDRGMLGRSFSEAGEGLERLLYFGNENIMWLNNEANPWFVRIFLIFLNVWLGFPFFMALMTGVMTSINKHLYEAASIDGATNFQQFKFITLPLVLVATSPLLIMAFAMNFNNFGMIYFITGGGPADGRFSRAYAGQTDILISWIYKLTTDQTIRWYNMASVFSILIFLVIGTVSAWNFSRTRAFKEDD